VKENSIFTKEYFEKEFENPDPWDFLTSNYEQKKYIRQIFLVKDRLPNPKRILEIGCGEGAHTILIAKKFPNAKIIGVDISSTAIHRAKKNVKNDKVEFLEEDIVKYLYYIQDEHFDLIFWSESIYYIGDKLTLYELTNLFLNVVKKIKTNGILCTANIIDQKNAPETTLTKRHVIECYFSILSHTIKLVNRSIYFEYKKESNQNYEYQIWLFEKKL